MTILTSIILIGAIIGVALAIAYNVQRGTKTLEELRANYYDNEEAQEVVELAKELYNKDLRPVATKKAPKKEKVTEQVESMKKVVEAHDTLIEEINRIAPEVTTPDTTAVNVEATVEVVKPKKKRKYYPKAPKGKA